MKVSHTLIKATMLLFSLIFFGMFFNLHAKATSIKQPNTGKYIYQYKDILTQNQIQVINDTNQQLLKKKHPQSIYVVIVPRIPSSSVPSDDSDGVDVGNFYGQGILDDFNGSKTDQLDKQGKLRTADDYSDYLDSQSSKANLLLLSTDDHQVGVVGSDFNQDYFSNRIWWKLRFGLNHGIKSNGPAQTVSFMRLFTRVSKATGKVAMKKQATKSLSWGELSSQIIAWLLFFAAVGAIIYSVWILKHGHGGGGGPSDNSYDDGFYDGYVQHDINDHIF